MSKKDEKTYSPEEVAKAVLAKAHEMLKKSELAKANTAHEIEAGEEPNNDDAEAPEYLANADIEESGQKKKKKQHSEDQDEMDHDDEMEDREIAEDEAEEEVEEHEDEYHKSENLEKSDKDKKSKKRNPDANMRAADAMVEAAKKKGLIKKEDKSVEQAAKEVMGDKDLDEVLDQMPSHKRDDVLRKLRQMKKQGMSKSKMMATCKSELAKCGATERGKKMSKSEANGKDGITKVYEFLAKSYAKKSEPSRMATPEEMESLRQAKEKKEKKDKLKKMAGMGAAGPKPPQGQMKPQAPQAKQPKMPSPSGSTGTKGY